MTYAAAITALKSTIDSVTVSGSAMAYAPDPRDRTLLKAGRAKFDGCYLIRNEGGGSIYPELQSNPSVFLATLTLEIGTELTTDATTQDGLVQLRAQKVMEKILTSDIANIINILPIGEPTKTTAGDRRILWSQRFRLVYEE
jgi:hypothetical protein|tara:strand:+ start:269 stop:694 length:426 start_codon:yes stop_codon:yes gene_type:complete